MLLIVPSAYSAPQKKNTGLQLTPLRSRPTLNPGDTTSGSLLISNNSDNPMTVDLTVEKFKTTDEEYNYQFSQFEHADWVRLVDRTIQLNAGQKQQVAYSLAIPVTAAPGGYYFSIIANTSNERDSSSSSLVEITRVASLVYLEVSGPIEKKLQLIGTDIPWLTTKRHLTLDARITNAGTSHTEAQLIIRTSLLPFRQIREIRPSSLILPKTIRAVHHRLWLSYLPGIYTVALSLPSPQGQTLTAQKHVLYLPWWFLILFASVLVTKCWKIIRRKHHLGS